MMNLIKKNGFISSAHEFEYAMNIFRENEGRPELNVIIVRKGLLSTPASNRDWLANCVDTRAFTQQGHRVQLDISRGGAYIFLSHALIIESLKNPARLRTSSTIDAFLLGLVWDWQASNRRSDSDRISPIKMSNFPPEFLSPICFDMYRKRNPAKWT